MALLSSTPAKVMNSIWPTARRIALRALPRATVFKLQGLLRKYRSFKIKHSSVGGFPTVDGKSQLATPSGKPNQTYNVGCILDEFSLAAWSPEFNMMPITPGNQLPSIDFMFVEAAWEGNGGSWRHHLAGSNAPSPELQNIINQCRKAGVPTVFWNKEDPAHFDDFLSTASLFDLIATTDSDQLESYRKAFPDKRIFLLPFAAQPVLQNPARNGIPDERGDIAFAGTYFRHKFADRRNQMDLLLGAAHDLSQRSNLTFTIFSRHLGGDRKYQFPTRWRKHVVGSLPYREMLAAYRSYKVFLNVNSITRSPSMCARRIFEICASGTPVVSTKSMAIPNFFSEEEVSMVSSPNEAELVLRSLTRSEMLRRRTSHLALRRVWEEHTYRLRAKTLLYQLGLDDTSCGRPLVSVVCSTNRDTNLQHLLNQVASQTYKPFELLILGHGISLDPDIQDRAIDLGLENITFIHRSAETSLGACMNDLVKAASGQVIAKFDDDDFYLPNYLRDQVNTLVNMNADLVGKGSIYFYLSASNLMVRRWKHHEHVWRNFVAGATFVGWRDVFLDTPFADVTKGEDTELLRRLEAKGRKIYSSDSFNYLCVRGNTDHTWSISNEEILANSDVESLGLNLEHMEV